MFSPLRSSGEKIQSCPQVFFETKKPITPYGLFSINLSYIIGVNALRRAFLWSYAISRSKKSCSDDIFCFAKSAEQKKFFFICGDPTESNFVKIEITEKK